jgi:hypothetical protein
LIFDGCGTPNGDFFFDVCMEYNIMPFPVPPHSSNQVEPLDLCVFSISKGSVTSFTELEERSFQSVHIVRFVSAIHSACNRMSVIDPVRNVGIALGLEQAGISASDADMRQDSVLWQWERRL